jgi:hypothetical protein
MQVLVEATVGTDPGTNHRIENLRRCSLHRRERSAARGRMVCDLAQGSSFLPDGSSASRGRTIRACAGVSEFASGA